MVESASLNNRKWYDASTRDARIGVWAPILGNFGPRITKEALNSVFRRITRPTIRPSSIRGSADTVRGWRPSRSTMRMLVATGIILLVIIVLFATSSFWINWWWFESVGYRSVLVRNYTVKTVSFVAFGLCSALFVLGNIALVLR